MTEGGTAADFQRWVEPHLTTLARYAGRRVPPAERDDVVQRALSRAYQRWSTYDASRRTAVAWLLGIVASESSGDATRQPPRDVVELVDRAGTGPQTRDVDLERAVEGLGRRERTVVDLYHFVDLDLATVAEVVHGRPPGVEATLAQARDRLRRLLGDDDDGSMRQRLSVAARRWQDEQPPAPEVLLQRLDEPLRRQLPWRRALAGAALALLVGGAVVVISGQDRGGDSPAAHADIPRPSTVHHGEKTVPFRRLEPAYPALGRGGYGALTTPFDSVRATGDISGTVHAGDTLTFDVVLEAPGLVSLLPCPDYTITLGTSTTTRQLNCAQVPYYASLVRSTGRVTGFRPVLPAGTQVVFRMRMPVPAEPGRQEVRWALDGPHPMPGFSGAVEVTLP